MNQTSKTDSGNVTLIENNETLELDTCVNGRKVRCSPSLHWSLVYEYYDSNEECLDESVKATMIDFTDDKVTDDCYFGNSPVYMISNDCTMNNDEALINQSRIMNNELSMDDIRRSVSCVSEFDAYSMLDDWDVSAMLVLIDEDSTVELSGSLLLSRSLFIRLAQPKNGGSIHMFNLTISGNTTLLIENEVNIDELNHVHLLEQSSLILSNLSSLSSSDSSLASMCCAKTLVS